MCFVSRWKSFWCFRVIIIVSFHTLFIGPTELYTVMLSFFFSFCLYAPKEFILCSWFKIYTISWNLKLCGIKLNLYISQSTIVENVYLRHTEFALPINRLHGNFVYFSREIGPYIWIHYVSFLLVFYLHLFLQDMISQ